MAECEKSPAGSWTKFLVPADGGIFGSCRNCISWGHCWKLVSEGDFWSYCLVLVSRCLLLPHPLWHQEYPTNSYCDPLSALIEGNLNFKTQTSHLKLWGKYFGHGSSVVTDAFKCVDLFVSHLLDGFTALYCWLCFSFELCLSYLSKSVCTHRTFCSSTGLTPHRLDDKVGGFEYFPSVSLVFSDM